MCACVFPCVCVPVWDCVPVCACVFPYVPPTSPCVHVPTGGQGDKEAEAGPRTGPGPRRTRVQGSRTSVRLSPAESSSPVLCGLSWLCPWEVKGKPVS